MIQGETRITETRLSNLVKVINLSESRRNLSFEVDNISIDSKKIPEDNTIYSKEKNFKELDDKNLDIDKLSKPSKIKLMRTRICKA